MVATSHGDAIDGPRVLAGLRVLDFSRYIAGPYCASILCDLSAEVIRVEPIGGGEDRFLAPVTDRGEGALFIQLNRSKKSIALDFQSEEGREVIGALVRTADVVVTNMPPDTLRRSRLDYESLRKLKSDIIATNISGFGSEGPLQNRTGFDAVGQAMSGAAYLGGTHSRPSRAGSSYVDYGTGLAGALGTLAALLHRRETGKGQDVNASLFATAMTFINAAHIEAAATGVDRAPHDNRSPYTAPSDFLPTQDGAVAIQVVGNAMFARWARMAGRAELADDPRFASDARRGNAGAILSETMAEWSSRRTTAEVLARLAEARIPAGPVRSPKEAIDDAETWGSGVFACATHPDLDTAIPVSRLLVSFGEWPRATRMSFPAPGMHTRTVLRTAGYDDKRITELMACGVVSGPER